MKNKFPVLTFFAAIVLTTVAGFGYDWRIGSFILSGWLVMLAVANYQR